MLAGEHNSDNALGRTVEKLVECIDPTTVTEEKCFAAMIPNEILVEIFIGCLHDDPLQNLQPDVTIAPLLLCHISSSWRTIALSLPRLWEDLRLDLGHVKVRSSYLAGLLKKKVDVLEFWTSNAAHLHLSLHLSFNNRDNFGLVEQPEFLPFWELFSVSSISSARLLDLHQLSHWNIKALFNPFSHFSNGETYDFPNLETFVLRGDPVNPFGLSPHSRIDFERTPSLRRLAVNLLKLSLVHFAEITFRWENLTHCLIACHVCFPDWYKILVSCVNLVFGAFLLDMLGFGRHEPTVLPNLRQLTVKCEGKIRQGIFVDLSFPSLTALRLSILDHSSPLKIQRLLVPMPSLVEFHLQSCIALDDSSDALSIFVPNLQILVIDGFIFCGSISPLDDVTKVLCSSWLTNGWLSYRSDWARIEYIVGPRLKEWKGLTGDRIREYVAQHLASLPEHPFPSVVIKDESELLWDWPLMTAHDLEHRWEEKMKFYERIIG